MNGSLSNLERKLRGWALPQLTLILVVGQVVAYFFIFDDNPGVPEGINMRSRLLLVPQKVLAGEVWRLATFLVVPPVTNLLFAIFFWYLFYLMGTALEHTGGAFRYNVYFLVGDAATVAVSFLTPEQPSSNGYLLASVLLAFAFLYPDFQSLHLLYHPAQNQMAALLTWVGYLVMLAKGDWLDRLLILASVCNFLLFFGQEILKWWQTGLRQTARPAADQRFGLRERPFYHRCTVCGITDRTHPDMDFRYCSKCAVRGYCMEHLHQHEHVTDEPAAR